MTTVFFQKHIHVLLLHVLTGLFESGHMYFLDGGAKARTDTYFAIEGFSVLLCTYVLSHFLLLWQQT